MLPDAGPLSVFLIAALVICLTPGPDMMYVVTFGLSKGWRGGLCAASGVAVGMIFHTLIAAAGLSAILRAAAWPLDVLRLVGAAYLLYLGVQMIRSRSALSIRATESHASYGRVFLSSTLVNVTNPKILVFYLSFLPQFATGSAGDVGRQMLTLGLIFALMGFIVDAIIGVSSGAASIGLAARTSGMRKVNIVGGAVLCGLAGVAAFTSA